MAISFTLNLPFAAHKCRHDKLPADMAAQVDAEQERMMVHLVGVREEALEFVMQSYELARLRKPWPKAATLRVSALMSPPDRFDDRQSA